MLKKFLSKFYKLLRLEKNFFTIYNPIMNDKSFSKFLSLILRHKPETVGIKLDGNGWADVAELLKGINSSGRSINFATLEKIVRENDKQRFSFNEDKTKIRANQGHSVKVDVELEEKVPPKFLYHGTIERNANSIAIQGLIKGSRLYVHLSADVETAQKVAARRKGKPIIYKIFAQAMHDDGYKFYQSKNGVWLTETVPPKYFCQLQASSFKL